MSVLSTPQITYERSLIPKAAKQYEVTNSTFFYKDNVDDETEPEDVRDDLQIPTVPTIPITATQSLANLPSVGATYGDTFMQQVRSLGPTRQRKAPDVFHPEECFMSESLTAENEEPQSLKEALDAEYSLLISNETWKLVPKDTNIVGSKWVLKVKRDADGNINPYKVRLVAQGYSQTQGVDYEEVFSPVARYSSIRTLLVLANAYDLAVHQMDFKTAFLNGTVDHDIYMSQPEGFVDPDHPDYECKLKKSLYGLKQSARCWNQTLDNFLVTNGSRRSPADECIYVKTVRRDDGFISFVILAVYVDDIIPVSSDVKMLKAEKESLCREFEMVDLGEILFILGMSIKRHRATRSLTISQGQYLRDLLKRCGMEECKPMSTPLESGKKFHKRTDEEERCGKSIYQQAIGCLTYVSTARRPDNAAAVVTLSQFMSDQSKEHWMGVKRKLRYIKGTLSYGLKFSVNDDECDLYGFS